MLLPRDHQALAGNQQALGGPLGRSLHARNRDWAVGIALLCDAYFAFGDQDVDGLLTQPDVESCSYCSNVHPRCLDNKWTLSVLRDSEQCLAPFQRDFPFLFRVKYVN